MNTKQPKRLWIRTLKSGKTAVAEYLGLQRHNIVEPFMFAIRPDVLNHLGGIISRYRASTKREVVARCEDNEAKLVAQYLGLEVE